MTRRTYIPPANRADPRNIAAPEPGYWMIRLVKGGPAVPAMIECRPHEPGNPFNVLDRSPRSLWHAEIDGEPADVERVWNARPVPGPDDKPQITRAEYDYQVALGRHAKEYLPNHPRANPRSKIDLMTVPLPFGD